MQTPRFAIALTTVALLAVTITVLPASAQTSFSTQWGGTEHVFNSITRVSGSGITQAVNPANGLIASFSKQDAGTDVCWLSITDDEGATVVPNKATTITLSLASQVWCFGGWIDADSLFITNGAQIIRSDNGGQTFSSLTTIDSASGTGEAVRDVYVLDTDTWFVAGILSATGNRGYFARTDNAGSTWTYSNVPATGQEIMPYSMDYSATSGVAIVIYDATAVGYKIWASSTSGATTNSFALAGTTIDTASTAAAVLNGGTWVTETTFGVPISFNAANSLITTDFGFALTTDYGATFTYDTIFVMPAGYTSGSMAVYSDETGQDIAMVSATISGTSHTIVGLADDEGEWQWRELEDFTGAAPSLTYPNTYGTNLYIGLTKTATGGVFLEEGPNFVFEGSATWQGIFCSAQGNENFGYGYVEDVTLEADGSGELGETDQIDPAYVFEGGSDDFAYLAKSWQPGSRWVSSYFMIEAQRDNQASIFRSNFGIVSGDIDQTSGATLKGDGEDSQHFSGHVEVQFKEVDNDWNIRIYHVNTANGVSTRTALGTAFVGDAPNTPTHYNFTVNTIENKAYLKHFVQGVETDVFGGGISLPSYWANQYFLNHWFVGSAVEVGGLLSGPDTAYTNLDPGVQDDSSTCLFSGDITQTPVPDGDSGRTPPEVADLSNKTALEGGDDNDVCFNNEDCDDQEGTCTLFCMDSSNVPQGFTATGFNALLGVLLMAGVGGGFYFIDTKSRHSMLFASVGAGIGFFLAFFFGLFPLWLVLVGVLVAAAVLVFRFRGMAGA